MTLTPHPLRGQVGLSHELLYFLPKQTYILCYGMLLFTLFHYLDFYCVTYVLACLPR